MTYINTPGASAHYNKDYFDWQKNIGAFGGWANSYKFKNTIKKCDVVLDFGCGGGFLLSNLVCKKKIGIEPNAAASDSIVSQGIEHFCSPSEALKALGHGAVDVIISNHALEHTLNPLEELKALRLLLKNKGSIHFFVPCDSVNYSYNPKDINYHLYSWSPQNLGNLFHEAGFDVIYSRPYLHKWPPYYKYFAKMGWPIFNIICKIYCHIERSWWQVEVKARNK